MKNSKGMQVAHYHPYYSFLSTSLYYHPYLFQLLFVLVIYCMVSNFRGVLIFVILWLTWQSQKFHPRKFNAFRVTQVL